jgi:hypothetical protein
MSLPISFPAGIAATVLDTVLGRLALVFRSGAAGDLTTARHAAVHMLAAYDAQTDDELRLAGKIISFSFEALEALSQAAAPELSLNNILRLRAGAVSLSRESHKAQRQLDKLQRARRVGRTAQPAEAVPASQPDPQPHTIADSAIEAIAVTETCPNPIDPPGKIGRMTWTQSYHKRLAAQCITEQLKKNQAEHAARSARQDAMAATHAADAAADAQRTAAAP